MKMEFILFFAELCKREKVKISLDLKLDIKMERKMSIPIRIRIFCFLESFILDPSRKNRATAAKIEATITMERLNIIIFIVSRL